MNKHFLTTILLWGFAFLALIHFAFDQPQSFLNNAPQVEPFSLGTAALFKVLERPIATCTGTVPICPLMGVSSDPLLANLSLNYNGTGGIKVREIASSVWANGYIIENSSANRQGTNNIFSSPLCFKGKTLQSL